MVYSREGEWVEGWCIVMEGRVGGGMVYSYGRESGWRDGV